MIICFSGEKGGPGKTTLSTNIAPLFDDLLVVDCDRNSNFSLWADRRSENKKLKPITTIQKFGANIHKDVLGLRSKYKNILIDTSGNDSMEMRSAITVADTVIFPLCVSQFDLWTVSPLLGLIERAKILNPRLKCFFVLNQLPTNTNKELEALLEVLSDIKEVKLLKPYIYSRKVYRSVVNLGCTVMEFDPPDSKARSEIVGLYKAIAQYYQ